MFQFLLRKTDVAKKVKLAPDVDLDEIAMNSRADGYSGADCAALLREAGFAVLKEGALRTGRRSIGLEKLRRLQYLRCKSQRNILIMRLSMSCHRYLKETNKNMIR